MIEPHALQSRVQPLIQRSWSRFYLMGGKSTDLRTPMSVMLGARAVSHSHTPSTSCDRSYPLFPKPGAVERPE